MIKHRHYIFLLSLLLTMGCGRSINSVTERLYDNRYRAGQEEFEIYYSNHGLVIIHIQEAEGQVIHERYETGYHMNSDLCVHFGSFSVSDIGVGFSVEPCGNRSNDRTTGFYKFWYIDKGNRQLIELDGNDVERISDGFYLKDGEVEK